VTSVLNTNIEVDIVYIHKLYVQGTSHFKTGHILTYRVYFARKVVAEKNGLIKPLLVYKQLHTTTINITRLQASSSIQ
jgi:hypothetical protein